MKESDILSGVSSDCVHNLIKQMRDYIEGQFAQFSHQSPNVCGVDGAELMESNFHMSIFNVFVVAGSFVKFDPISFLSIILETNQMTCFKR